MVDEAAGTIPAVVGRQRPSVPFAPPLQLRAVGGCHRVNWSLVLAQPVGESSGRVQTTAVQADQGIRLARKGQELGTGAALARARNKGDIPEVIAEKPDDVLNQPGDLLVGPKAEIFNLNLDRDVPRWSRPRRAVRPLLPSVYRINPHSDAEEVLEASGRLRQKTPAEALLVQVITHRCSHDIGAQGRMRVIRDLICRGPRAHPCFAGSAKSDMLSVDRKASSGAFFSEAGIRCERSGCSSSSRASALMGAARRVSISCLARSNS